MTFFLSQVAAETVKDLDANLFYGDEIRGVYQEIAKTMPKDHLCMDNVS